jgi:hypothetical protein
MTWRGAAGQMEFQLRFQLIVGRSVGDVTGFHRMACSRPGRNPCHSRLVRERPATAQAPVCQEARSTLDGAAAPTRQPVSLPAPMALHRCAGRDEVVRTHPFVPYGRPRPGETPVRTALGCLARAQEKPGPHGSAYRPYEPRPGRPSPRSAIPGGILRTQPGQAGSLRRRRHGRRRRVTCRR